MLDSSRISASSRRLTKPLPLQASRTFLVSSSRITGISFCGVLGCRTRSIGERSISSSSTQPLEELLQALVLVQRGRRRPGLDHPGLERLDVPPGDRGRVGGGGVGVRVRGVLGEVPAQLGGGQEVVVAGGLRIVAGAQGPVPVAQEPGPRRGTVRRSSLSIVAGACVTCRVKESNSGVLDLTSMLSNEKRAPAARDLRKPSTLSGRRDSNPRPLDPQSAIWRSFKN